MPLIRVPAAFDHPNWLFELKHDGFRALTVIERCQARFISRRGHEFKQWPELSEEIDHAVRGRIRGHRPSLPLRRLDPRALAAARSAPA